MAVNQNAKVTDKIKKGFELSELTGYPQKIADAIIPTMEVWEDICDVADSVDRTGTGTGTFYTTPTNKDFFLTSLSAFYLKDAACDSATGTYSLFGVVNGKSVELISLPVITLTAGGFHANASLPVPVKLDRGTTLTMTGAFAAGVCVRGASWRGFTREGK